MSLLTRQCDGAYDFVIGKNVHFGDNQLETGECVMFSVATFHRIVWVLPALLALFLAFVVGCGTSTEPALSGESAPASGSLVSVGNQVGDRIQPFTLRLLDGSTVTSTELLNEDRATLLFFFKRG